MPKQTTTRLHEDPEKESIETINKLKKIAFCRMNDIATFNSSGDITEIDFEKAAEIGAVVSDVTRKVGRGQKAKMVRTVSITMPDTFNALMQLGVYLGLFEPPKRRRRRSKPRANTNDMRK
jgi:hypothetical protein